MKFGDFVCEKDVCACASGAKAPVVANRLTPAKSRAHNESLALTDSDVPFVCWSLVYPAGRSDATTSWRDSFASAAVVEGVTAEGDACVGVGCAATLAWALEQPTVSNAMNATVVFVDIGVVPSRDAHTDMRGQFARANSR